MDLHVLRHPRIEPIGGGPVWAEAVDTNPLSPACVPPHPLSSRLVSWSGWFEDDQTGAGTWGARGRGAFDAFCDRVEPSLREAGAVLLVRPHARHVISDVPSCADLLRRRGGGPFGLFVDPASMLSPSMLPDGLDHVERILAALAPAPGTAGVLVANAVLAPGPQVCLVPLTSGSLDSRRLAGLFRSIAPEVPLVVLDDDMDAPRLLLGR